MCMCPLLVQFVFGTAGSQLQEELVVAFITGIETGADAPLPGEEPSAIWQPELWVA